MGHVERAWGYSFQSPQVGPQLQAFEATLSQLMQGQPVGLATDYFNIRYATLAARLAKHLEDQKFGQVIPAAQLAGLWTAHNDARSYVVLGDPAVRLPLVRPEERPNRPAPGSARSVDSQGTAIPPGGGGPESPKPRKRQLPNEGPGSHATAGRRAAKETRRPVFDTQPQETNPLGASDAFLQQVAETAQRVEQASTAG
ncbi:MAG: hypothetical protein ACKOJF_25730, partial [Planctomycetaceae bacterium]